MKKKTTYFHWSCNILRSWGILDGKSFRDYLVQNPYFKGEETDMDRSDLHRVMDEPVVAENPRTLDSDPFPVLSPQQPNEFLRMFVSMQWSW